MRTGALHTIRPSIRPTPYTVAQVLRGVAVTPDVIELGEDEEVEMEEQPLLPPGTEEELEEQPPGEEGGRTVPAPLRAAIAEFQFQLGMEGAGASRREENWRPSPLPPRRRLSGGGGLGEGGERPQLVAGERPQLVAGERPQLVSPGIQRGGPPVAR